MSTADSGAPVRPPASSTGPPACAVRRRWHGGGPRDGVRADGSALRRVARTDPGSAIRADDPVPVSRTAPLPTDGAAHRGATPASDRGVTPWRHGRRCPASGAARPASARRVRLTVSRVDPWSAMKISFLLSVALGIAGVVMVFVLWTILAGMGVFDQINGIVGQVVQDGQQRFDIMDFIGLGRVLSLSIVIAVIDVILVTAIATLGAFLYNVSSALVGGVQLTLTDD